MNLQNRSEPELIQLLQEDVDVALDELMRRHKHPILSFCYRLLGNAADADEVAQDVFVRVYLHRQKIDPGQKFSTWLFALARNACIDRLRSRARQRTEPLPVAPLPGREDVAKAAQLGELEAAIAAAVAELPEEQRTAIILAEYHGQSYAEIAGAMRSSVKSVESRLYRAKQALQKSLARFL